MKSRCLIALTALIGLGMSQASVAQNKTCSDIDFTPEALSVYPDLASACQAVVYKDGKEYVMVVGRVLAVRGGGKHVNLQFKDGGRYWVNPNENQNIRLLPVGGVAGQQQSTGAESTKIRPSELVRGMELGIYLPTDTWAIHFEEEEVYVPVVMTPVETIEIIELEPMPTTASPVPLIGLLGGLFALIGAGFTFVRRRA